MHQRRRGRLLADVQHGAAHPQGGYGPGHQVKDLRIARAEAQARGAALPVLDDVADMYERLLAAGDGELGTQALIRAYGG